MEYVAIISIIVCLILILIEYLWLYSLSQNQERKNKRRRADEAQIVNSIEAILTASTSTGQEYEIEQLAAFVKNNSDRLDDLTDSMLKIILESENEEEKATIVKTLNYISPLKFYENLLRTGNTYEKVLACQKVAHFFDESEVPQIKKLLYSKNRDLAYNAAMALARLGNEEAMAGYIAGCGNNFEYSHRLIIEFLENYTGDIVSLCNQIFEKCDDYIMASIIKGIAKYKFTEFLELYRNNVNSRNINLVSASIKALGVIGEVQDEHALITATNHKNWVVRSTAVKALVGYKSEEALQAVKRALQDPEWWVRYNAARALIEMDKDLEKVEMVLMGYDKYASDAIKYALYKQARNN